MEKSFINLNKNEKKFLISLLEAGNKTDTKIAQELSISKATASRIRKKLEKSEIISEYIPIVNLDKLQINVFLSIMFEWNGFSNPSITKTIFEELDNDPHTIFLANGDGSEKISTVLFLGFRDLDEYHKYFRKKYVMTKTPNVLMIRIIYL